MTATGDFNTHILTLKPLQNDHEPLILTFCVTYIGEDPDWTYDCYCTEITRALPAQGGAYSMEIELKSKDYKTWELAHKPFELGDFGADADPEEVGVELTFNELVLRTTGFGKEGSVNAMVRIGNGDVLVSEGWDDGTEKEVKEAIKAVEKLNVQNDVVGKS